MVGLGNPGRAYAGTRHNIGFEVARAVAARWRLARARKLFSGLLSAGRAGEGGARVAVLLPQTFMNESGRSVGPARGSYRLPPERVVVIHDEIDLPFGEVRARRGGGLAGHNGLRSVSQAIGSTDFTRVRVGVGRPPSSDPEAVASYVLARFPEPAGEVRALIEQAGGRTEEVLRSGPPGDPG